MSRWFRYAGNRVVENAAILCATELTSRGLNVLVAIYAARALPLQEFGHLSFVLTLLGFVAVLSDIGLSTLLLKRVPTQSAGADVSAREEAAAALVVKLFLTGCWVIVALASVTHMGSGVRSLVMVGGVACGAKAYADVVSTLLKAHNRFRLDGLLRLVYSLAYAIAGLVSLLVHAGLVGFGMALLVASLIQGGVAAIIDRRNRYLQVSARRMAHGALYSRLVKASLPFATLSILGLIYFRIDTVMLQYLKGPGDVGLYSAAYRLFELLLMIPWAFSFALLPVFSEALSRGDPARAKRMAEQSLTALAVLGFPLAVLATRYAHLPLTLFYPMPTYQGSVEVLQILTWASIAVCLSSVTSTLINAGPDPSANARIALAMVILNVGSNIVLIPRWGPAGAAVATVVTEFGGLVTSGIYISRRLFALEYRFLIPPALAAVVMGLIIQHHPSIAGFLIALVAYAATWRFGSWVRQRESKQGSLKWLGASSTSECAWPRR